MGYETGVNLDLNISANRPEAGVDTSHLALVARNSQGLFIFPSARPEVTRGVL